MCVSEDATGLRMWRVWGHRRSGDAAGLGIWRVWVHSRSGDVAGQGPSRSGTSQARGCSGPGSDGPLEQIKGGREHRAASGEHRKRVPTTWELSVANRKLP